MCVPALQRDVVSADNVTVNAGKGEAVITLRTSAVAAEAADFFNGATPHTLSLLPSVGPVCGSVCVSSCGACVCVSVFSSQAVWLRIGSS